MDRQQQDYNATVIDRRNEFDYLLADNQEEFDSTMRDQKEAFEEWMREMEQDFALRQGEQQEPNRARELQLRPLIEPCQESIRRRREDLNEYLAIAGRKFKFKLISKNIPGLNFSCFFQDNVASDAGGR